MAKRSDGHVCNSRYNSLDYPNGVLPSLGGSCTSAKALQKSAELYVMSLSPAVVLWNVRAQGLVLSCEEWQYALQLAASNAWPAKGTRKPPISLDGEPELMWDGRYSPACGQEMTAADAGHFGRALRSSNPQKFSETVEKIARFAATGGFLICPVPEPDSAALAALMTATAVEITRRGSVVQPETETIPSESVALGDERYVPQR
jgi:hypothetical protein